MVPPSISLNIFTNTTATNNASEKNHNNTEDAIVVLASKCLARPVPTELLYDNNEASDDDDNDEDEDDDDDEYSKLQRKFATRLFRFWHKLQSGLVVLEDDDTETNPPPKLKPFRNDFIVCLWQSRFSPLVTKALRQTVSDIILQQQNYVEDNIQQQQQRQDDRTKQRQRLDANNADDDDHDDDNDDLEVILNDLRQLHRAIYVSYTDHYNTHTNEEDEVEEEGDDDTMVQDGTAISTTTNGIMEIVMAHLFESWIVRAWDGDTTRVEPILRRLITCNKNR